MISQASVSYIVAIQVKPGELAISPEHLQIYLSA